MTIDFNAALPSGLSRVYAAAFLHATDARTSGKMCVNGITRESTSYCERVTKCTALVFTCIRPQIARCLIFCKFLAR